MLSNSLVELLLHVVVLLEDFILLDACQHRLLHRTRQRLFNRLDTQLVDPVNDLVLFPFWKTPKHAVQAVMTIDRRPVSVWLELEDTLLPRKEGRMVVNTAMLSNLRTHEPLLGKV